MKFGKRFLTCLALLIAAVMSLSLFVACADEPEEPDDSASASTFVNQTWNGEYYYDSPSGEWTIKINSDGTYALDMGSGAQTGNYTYDGTTLSLGAAYTASYDVAGKAITLSLADQTYRFAEKIEYTVTFNTNGGSQVDSAKVINGRTLDKPADPTYNGKKFIGWYKDAGFNNEFGFNSEAVTANITLYARFVDGGDASAEFTVSFDLNGKTGTAPASVKTIGGVAYNLPVPEVAGETFVGWYISDYDDAEKLTGLYDENKLKKDTTLYAVWASDGLVVSLTGNHVDWTSVGTNSTYAVVIVNKTTGETVLSRRVTSIGQDYNFSVAGEYEISVSTTNASATAYYKYHLLDEAKLSVVDNSLVYEAVENAGKYLIEIDCGTEGHNHVAIDNGSSLYYDFSACDMKPEGIVFTVTAVADGYISSSASYTLVRNLDAVKDLAVNDQAIATWGDVENATGYVLTITYEGQTATYNVGLAKSYDLRFYNAGAIGLSVTALAHGYNSAAATEMTYNKTLLAAPAEVTVEGTNVVWTAVPGAVSYNVYIGGKVYNVATNAFALTGDVLVDGQTEYPVKVQAVAAEAADNSVLSNEVVLSYAFDTASYNAGVLSWNAFMGADSYNVYLNGELYLNTTALNAPITFDKAGENVVSVAYVSGEYESAPLAVTLEVYEIVLDTDGGVQIDAEGNNVTVTRLYLAKGDPVALSDDLTKRGYTFNGWYNVKGGAANQGIRYTDEFYGQTEGRTIYAYWVANTYYVTLHITDALTLRFPVTYDQPFELQPITNVDTTKAFAGWYNQINGAGTGFTNENGQSLRNWNTLQNVDLYPYWVDIFEFELITVNNEEGYRVTKSAGIVYVTEITIPATHNGKPVLELSSAAFYNTPNIKVINIPDSIQNCSESGSAFAGCTSLTAINIYVAEGNHYVEYASVDGVLYHYNEYESRVEIIKVPTGMTGELKIASHVSFDGGQTLSPVTALPVDALKGSQLTKVVIPYTVQDLNTNCFADCPNLVSIEFEATPEGVADVPLNIVKDVFSNIPGLTAITFPARIGAFDPESISNCVNLAEINIAGDGGNYSSVGGLITTKGSNRTIVYVPAAYAGQNGDGVFTVPEGVVAIGNNAFSYNTGVSDVVIPAWVTRIGVEAFAKRSSTGALTSNTTIQSVTFLGGADDNTLTIDDLAFYYCNQIKALTIPANCRVIGASAFGYTTVLTEVYVESSGEVNFADRAFGTNPTTGTSAITYYVTTLHIGKDCGAFGISGVFGPTKLTTIVIAEGNENFVSIDNIVYNKDVTAILYVPGEFEGEYVAPDTLQEISAGAFNARTGLTKVTIGYSVKSIGTDAFVGCTGLEEVVFAATPEGTDPVALTIGTQAFRGCTHLTEIELPERLTHLGSAVFFGCSTLESVSFPSTLESIEYGYSLMSVSSEYIEFNYIDLFESCTVLESLTVNPASTHFVAIDNVLYSLNEEGKPDVLLTTPRANTGDANNSIDIPSSVTLIEMRAFYYSNIDKITFSKGLDGDLTINSYAFYYANTTQLELPVGITEISPRAFYYMRYVTELTIPYTVTTVGYGAFYYCTGLTKLNFQETPEGVTPVPLRFEDAKLPGAATSSSSYAIFYYCSGLTELNFPERTTYIGTYACYYAVYQSLAKVTIPSTVIEIGDYAFYYSSTTQLSDVKFATRTEIVDGKEVQVSDLTKIGARAFYYASISELVLPDSVKEIGEYAFYYNRSLTSIKLPANLEFIGNRAFYYCSALLDITIPAKIRNIETYAFGYTSALREIKFAVDEETGLSSLQTIGTYAFTSSGIATFTFPETANPIVVGDTSNGQKRIFSACRSLTKVTFSSKLVDIDDMFYNCTSIREFEIPETNENFTSLPGYPVLMSHDGTAVRICVNFNGSVVLPEGVTSIDNSAFYNCTGIMRVTLPSTIYSIGQEAFYGCTGLTDVIFLTNENGESALAELGNGCFRGCSKLVSLRFPATSQLDTIPEYAFYGDTALIDFYLPATVSRVEQYSLYNCRGVVLRTLPENIKYVGNRAFYYVGLGSATITGDMELEQYAFAYADQMTSVVIKKDVQSLPNACFYYCTALESVEFEMDENDQSDLTSVGYEVFYHTDALTSVKLPGSIVYVVGTAATTAGSSAGMFYYSGVEEVIYGEGTNLIPAYSFEYTSNLSRVYLPDSVELIGPYAFYYSALEEINIPWKVALIDNYAFGATTSTTATYATRLNKVTFDPTPEGEEDVVLKMGHHVFYYTSELEEIEFPDRLTFDEVGSTTTSPGYYTFYRSGVKSVKLPSTLKIIPYYFLATQSGYGTIESIEIPDTVEEIGGYAFYYQAQIPEIKLPAGLKEIGNYAFYHMDGISSITLPENLETIGTYAFGYLNITEITIPKSVKSIGNYAFTYDQSLTKVTFEEPEEGETVENLTVGTYLFNYCSALEEVELPDRLVIAATTSSPTTSGAGAYMFYHSGVKKVTLGEGIKAIPYYMFGYSALERFEISKDITVIGPYAFAYIDNFEQLTFEDRTAALTIYGAVFYNDSKLTEIALPDTVKFTSSTGTAVTTAGYNLFYGTGIREFTIPSGWTAIPYGMFDSTALESIVIPNTVTSIGSYAFRNCHNLEEVTFEDRSANLTFGGSIFYGDEKITEMELPTQVKFTAVQTSATGAGAQLFYGTGIKEFTIPSNWTAIPYGIFDSTPIESITIPKTITAIGSYAFRNCTELKEVKFEARTAALTLNGSVFYGDASLTKIDLPSQVKFTAVQTSVTGAGAQLFYGTGIKEFTIPSGWTAIPYGMFDSSALESIVIPSTITMIGSYAFRNCHNLEEVTFAPRTSGFTTVNGSIFINDEKLTKIELPAQMSITAVGSATTSGGYMFSNTGIKEFTVPAGWSMIPYGLFDGAALEKITIPAAITQIGTYAFRNCENLTSVEFEEGSKLTTVGGSVFMGTPNLKSVELPSGVAITAVGSYSATGPTGNGAGLFMNSGVEEVTLPAGVTVLTAQMFSGAVNLKKLTVLGNLTTTFTTYYPGYSTESYRSYGTFYGNELLEEIVFAGSTTSLGANLFRGMHTSVPTTITFKGDVGSIGYYAFNAFDGLKSVTFEGDVATLDYSTFEACETIENVDFNGDVGLVNYRAFYGAENLKEVNFNGALNQVSYYAFYNCHSLEKVTFKGKVGTFGMGTAQGQRFSTGPTYTGYHIFTNCRSLESVTFEQDVDTIGACAFFNCRGLVELNFFGDISRIDPYAFAFDTTLESVDFNNVFTLGDYAFYNDAALERVTYENILTYGSYVFAETSLKAYELPEDYTIGNVFDSEGLFYNSNLESFVLPKGVTAVPNYFFAGCANLANVTVLGELVEVGEQAFYGTAITDFTLGDSLEAVDREAFAGSLITEVKVPKNLTSIGNGAFGNCPIVSVTVSADNEVYAVDANGNLYDKKNNVVAMILPALSGEFTFRKDYTYQPQAFQGTKVTKLIIEEGITEISEYAFYGMPELAEVVLPASLKVIGNYAFANCEKLSVINKPAALTEIGDYAFANDGFASVTLADGLTKVGNYAFAANKNLKKVDISDTIETFGQYLFADCDALEEVNFLGNRTEITGVLSSTDLYMFAGCDGEITLSYPATTVAGGRSMFRECTADKITLAEGVEKVLDYMFYYSNAHEIVLPTTVHAYGTYAFGYLNASDNGDEPSSRVLIKGDVENTLNYTFYHAVVDTIEFAEGVKSIDTTVAGTTAAYGFLYYGYMNNVIFPSTLETINSPYFMYYGAEKSIDLSKTKVTELPIDFAYTTSTTGEYYQTLTSVKLPQTLKSIGNYAFYYQKNLTEIELPEGLEELGNYVFYYNTSLTSVRLPSTLKTIGTYVFAYCSALETVEMPENLTTLGNYMFYYCSGLKHVDFPAGLEYIGSYAFGYSGLEEVYIPSSVTSMGTYAFEYCTSLNKVTYAANLETTANYMFYYSDNIKEIVIEEGVKSLPNYIFYYAIRANKVGVTLPSTLESIGTYAFYYCTTLDYVTVPATVKSIGNYAFNGVTCTIYMEAADSAEMTLGTNWSGTSGARVVWGSKGPVYLNAGIWDVEDANERYAAYLFSSDTTVDGIWLDLTANADGTYSVVLPAGYDYVIFARMDGASTENEWANAWNQTNDLSLVGYYGKTFTIESWGDGANSQGRWN